MPAINDTKHKLTDKEIVTSADSDDTIFVNIDGAVKQIAIKDALQVEGGIADRVTAVEGEVDELNSNFIVEEITLTMKNGWTAGTSQKAFKMGKLIYILVDVIAPTNITRNQEIFTLPEGMILQPGAVTRVQLRQYSNSTDAPFIRTVLWNNGVFATDNNNDSGAVTNATYQGQIIALLH